MKRAFRTGLIALSAWAALTGQAAPQSPALAPEAREAMQTALGQALQGDMSAALTALRRLPDDRFTGPAAAIRTCMLGRFGAAANTPAPALPPTATRALALYQAYWRAGLLDPAAWTAAEERLRTGLVTLLGLPAATTLDDTEAPLLARLETEGVHALGGITPPFRELMLWRGQTSAVREVALPEGVHRTRVFMLDDFASLGWAGYATCDRSHTGGWVRADGIYAVSSGWGDLREEAFQVSFLAHEIQHFADKENYGNLPPWELEFRAKLTELALARTSQALLLEAFSHSQSDDRGMPHPYANAGVLAALRTRLGLAADAGFAGVAPDAIRSAARAELLADSARRHATG